MFIEKTACTRNVHTPTNTTRNFTYFKKKTIYHKKLCYDCLFYLPYFTEFVVYANLCQSYYFDEHASRHKSLLRSMGLNKSVLQWLFV